MRLRKLLAAGLLMAAAATGQAQPRYIFMFIGDGMGHGQIMATETFNRTVLGNAGRLNMMQLPYAGFIATYPANGTVTDSAAAGTALATGHKTRNGMLGMDADTTAVSSVAATLHDAGWGVGLVTTVAPDDATPGAFYAHVPARRMTYDIGLQAAESGYEFIAGATWRGARDRSGKPTDLLQRMAAAGGIDMVTDVEAAAASDSARVILTSATPFNENNVGFTVDSLPGALVLPAMTAACISHLEKVSPERFFMMVEGGNIDHIAHGNDAAGVIREVMAFDEAIGIAMDFYRRHPEETLIIVTADHETGGMTVGNRTSGYNSRTDLITTQRMSKDRFSREIGRLMSGEEPLSWDAFLAFTALNTGLGDRIPLKDADREKLRSLYDATRQGDTAGQKTLYASFNALTNEVYNILNNAYGIGWTTYGHTGNPVPVYAGGRGMERVTTLRDNTGIAPLLLDLAGF